MKNRAIALFAASVLICLVPAAQGAITPYSQDFEGLVQSSPTALAEDGWLVYGNVFTGEGSYLYGYGPFTAPNDGFAFSQIDMGQGGVEQGWQQLAIFSDYNNADHAVGNLIESNFYQEMTIDAGDVGKRWIYEFQAKLGNLEGASTALAYLKTLDPNNGYATTNFITVDMTDIPDTWGGFSLQIDIDASLAGQLIQFGFSNTATLYEGSGVFYDNIIFYEGEISDVPDGSAVAGATLRQNFPNPFNPLTKIGFALDQPGQVDLSVFDIAGHRVASLKQGHLEAGEHFVNWNGRNDSGAASPAGQYFYVLKTAAGQVSRSMVLLK